MIEYNFTLNYEQQQVLIYWCAFFVCLLPFYIERIISYNKDKSTTQKSSIDTVKGNYIEPEISILEKAKNKQSYKYTNASETINWEFGSTTKYDKKIIFIKDDVNEETNYIETEI